MLKNRNRTQLIQISKWLSSPKYAERFGAHWYQVYPKMPNLRKQPTRHGKISVDLLSKLDSEFPETGVLKLNHALIFGQQGWIFSQEGHFLSDHSWYGRHLDEIQRIIRFCTVTQHLKGICLSLASDFSISSYGHFLLDCIPRLELFFQAGFKLSDVDYIFCPKPPSRTAQHLFEHLNIPIRKCIWADENQNTLINAETLLAPTFPGTRRNYPSWASSFLQTTFLPVLPSANRRLYITRSGFRRNVANEEEIIPILRKYGFEIYSHCASDNEIKDYAEASIVVGAHGGGLANLAFCQPSIKVLELIPTDHIYPYYYTLAEAAGLDYAYLAGRSISERKPGTFGPSSVNFYVNKDEFEKALAQMTK